MHPDAIIMSPAPQTLYSQVTKSVESAPCYHSVAFVVVAFIIGFIVKRRYLSPLRRFPGPFWASVSRWWMVREVFSGQHEKNMVRLHAKYGKFVRISPWEADADSMKQRAEFLAIGLFKISMQNSLHNGSMTNLVQSLPEIVLLVVWRELTNASDYGS